jgi:WD40 repeat protein
MSKRVVRLSAVVGLAVAAACESVTVPVPSGDVRLTVVAAGDTQSATVNTAVAVAPSVRVTLPTGRPVAGRPVMFAQVRGSNTSAPQTVETDADGIASMSEWVLGGRGGIQEVVAFVVGATTDVKVSFFAVASAGPIISAALLPGFSAVNVGDTARLTLDLRDIQQNVAAPPTPVVYVSSDTTVVRVDSNGLTTAVAYGSAAITATTGAFSRTATVGVRAGLPPTPSITTSPNTGIQLGRAAVTPSGVGLVVSVGGGRIYRTNLATLAFQDSLILPGSTPTSEIAMTPAGDRLYIAQQNVVTLVDVPSMTALRTITLPTSVSALAASPTGDYIYATQSNGVLQRISVATDAITTLNISGNLRGVAVHPTADRLYVTAEVGALHEVNTATFSVIRTVFFANGAGRVDLSPDGERVFVSRPGNLMDVRNRIDLAVIRTIPGTPDARALAFSTAGRYLMVLTEGSGDVRVYDAATYETLHTIALSGAQGAITDPVTGLVFVTSSLGVLHRVTIATPP